MRYQQDALRYLALMGHVYARVSGFGWTIVPRFPFRFEHVEGDARALCVEHAGSPPRSAIVRIDADGPRLTLSPGTPNAADVCDLTVSDASEAFRVETSAFTVGWPVGFDVVSAEPGGPSPFDFLSEDGSLLYVQGPLAEARVPRLEAMAAPGQRIVDRGSHGAGEWVELTYEHDGGAYWQRHATVRWAGEMLLVLTAQALAEHSARTRHAAAFVLGTLEAWRGSAPYSSA